MLIQVQVLVLQQILQTAHWIALPIIVETFPHHQNVLAAVLPECPVETFPLMDVELLAESVVALNIVMVLLTVALVVMELVVAVAATVEVAEVAEVAEVVAEVAEVAVAVLPLKNLHLRINNKYLAFAHKLYF